MGHIALSTKERTTVEQALQAIFQLTLLPSEKIYPSLQEADIFYDVNNQISVMYSEGKIQIMLEEKATFYKTYDIEPTEKGDFKTPLTELLYKHNMLQRKQNEKV